MLPKASMRQVFAALLVTILMLSNGSLVPAHAQGAGHHEHGAQAAHEHDHHDEGAARPDDASTNEDGTADAGTVPGHNHVVGDQAPAAVGVSTPLASFAPLPPALHSERPPASATVLPPLKPPSA